MEHSDHWIMIDGTINDLLGFMQKPILLLSFNTRTQTLHQLRNNQDKTTTIKTLIL